MKFQFRLTFFHSTPGIFQFEQQSLPLDLEEEREIILTARDADKLKDATKFHINGQGYLDFESARQSGERLRTRLRILNAMLSLGLTIPIVDSTSGSVSDEIKRNAFEKNGEIILDTIVGLSIFPDDGKHVEHIMNAKLNVTPSEPQYIVEAIKKVWLTDMDLDERSEDALNILNISTGESSPRAQFLTSFLALERMFERKPRSELAITLLKAFQTEVCQSTLTDKEKKSLIGSLSNLFDESFSSALIEFSFRIQNPTNISGLTPREFFSECIRVRNLIAHNAIIDSTINLQSLSENLKNVVLSLIWTIHGIPSVSIFRPSSSVSFQSMEIRIL